MKKLTLLIVFLIAASESARAIVFTDPGVLSAILQQTVTQTAEHLRQLEQEIQTVATLQQQLSASQGLLQLAQQNAQGLDGLKVVGDFNNIILSTNALINSIKSDINTDRELSGQWQNLFGTLDPWIQSTNSAFVNIDASDKTNSASYLIGDSYQRLYQQNAATVSQFVANANQVSEKGALKQIAQETAQLIQMENNVIYLLSQMLKAQSIEASNENLQRKERAVENQQDLEGVRAFTSIVDAKTFGI